MDIEDYKPSELELVVGGIVSLLGKVINEHAITLRVAGLHPAEATIKRHVTAIEEALNEVKHSIRVLNKSYLDTSRQSLESKE